MPGGIRDIFYSTSEEFSAAAASASCVKTSSCTQLLDIFGCITRGPKTGHHNLFEAMLRSVNPAIFKTVDRESIYLKISHLCSKLHIFTTNLTA
jgi:hypothetical protein